MLGEAGRIAEAGKLMDRAKAIRDKYAEAN